MAGRGRGRFRNETNEIKLGEISKLESGNVLKQCVTSPDQINIDSSYDNIMLKIKTIDLHDNEVETEKKNQEIKKCFEDNCSTAESVKNLVEEIHRRSLNDSSFLSKVVSMFSSQLFSSVNIHDVKVRNLFITKMQQDFENITEMQKKNPVIFRNAIRMLGEYYHKAKIGMKPLHFLATPLSKYLVMLLQSAQEEDIELFAVQLYMNGKGLKSTVPEYFNKLLLRVRATLANNYKLTTTSKIWLLFSLDVANYRFGLLPNDIHQFYVSLLGDSAMTHCQRMNTELTIQTEETNEIFDQFKSIANVLKLDNKISNNVDGNMSQFGGGDSFGTVESNSISKNQDQFKYSGFENYDGPKPSFGREKYLAKAQTYKKISPDNGGMANLAPWDSLETKKENAPRPILGVGARLKEKSQAASSDWQEKTDNASNWRQTDSELNPAAAGWEFKSKSGSGWINSNSSKKPWNQHDDRTETDYT